MTVAVSSKVFNVDTTTAGLAKDLSTIGAYGSTAQNSVINALKNATAADATHETVAGAKYVATKSVTNGTDATNVKYALDVSSSPTATTGSSVIKIIDKLIIRLLRSQGASSGFFL